MSDNLKIGEQLKQEYLNSLSDEEVSRVRSKVKDMLNSAVEEIRQNIKDKKEPVAITSSMKSQLGIESKNIELEKLFQSFSFRIISREMADDMGLSINIEANVKFDPISPDHPAIEFVCIITFK